MRSLPKTPDMENEALRQNADSIGSAFERLVYIMQRLRAPEGGCPWDLEQNFESIAPYTIEEAYEVADAIERGSRQDLCEELGDLALQVVYHAQLAAEEQSFDVCDVLNGICEKMLRRHPHVFDGLERPDWDAVKAAEKSQKTTISSALDDIPSALPALTRAEKLTRRAARVGFDWPNTDDVLDKIIEEAGELTEAPEEEKQSEFGDLLFATVNLGRKLGLDAETALRSTNAKFTRRFQFIEATLAEQGRKPEQSNLAEMDALWDAAKQAEKSQNRS